MTKLLPRLPKLPMLLDRKLYKTGQTRGAANKEIYQNRVGRSSTVLIPWEYWDECKTPDDDLGYYEKGFIVLIDPEWYFTTDDADEQLSAEGVELGLNAVLLFQQRRQWDKYALAEGELLPNGRPFTAPTSRVEPVGGTAIARVHSTTAADAAAIIWGFNEKSLRGAGIRVYEYASTDTIDRTRVQLEALFWTAEDALDVVTGEGMSVHNANKRRDTVLKVARDNGLFDVPRMQNLRFLDEDEKCICPLCLERLSAGGFLQRGAQAAGRETWDITITEVSLFHVEELRVGSLQHKPYNLAWGHHFCNVVAKDAGIEHTLQWMRTVVQRNVDSGWGDQRSNKVESEVSTSGEATEALLPD